MGNLEHLAEAVRQRRLALDLSQLEAAQRAHVSEETWSKVERGLRISDRYLMRIERALGWLDGTIAAILEGREPAEDAPPDLRAEVARLRQEVELLRRTVETLTEQR